MEKYLKDRKKRKLSLEEIEHYIRVAKAIERTIEVQGKTNDVFLVKFACKKVYEHTCHRHRSRNAGHNGL